MASGPNDNQRAFIFGIGQTESGYDPVEAYKEYLNKASNNSNVRRYGYKKGADHGYFQNNQMDVDSLRKKLIKEGMSYNEAHEISRHLNGGGPGGKSTREQQELAMHHRLRTTFPDAYKLAGEGKFNKAYDKVQNHWFGVNRDRKKGNRRFALQSAQRYSLGAKIPPPVQKGWEPTVQHAVGEDTGFNPEHVQQANLAPMPAPPAAPEPAVTGSKFAPPTADSIIPPEQNPISTDRQKLGQGLDMWAPQAPVTPERTYEREDLAPADMGVSGDTGFIPDAEFNKQGIMGQDRKAAWEAEQASAAPGAGSSPGDTVNIAPPSKSPVSGSVPDQYGQTDWSRAMLHQMESGDSSKLDALEAAKPVQPLKLEMPKMNFKLGDLLGGLFK